MVPPGPVNIGHKKMATKDSRIDFMFLGSPYSVARSTTALHCKETILQMIGVQLITSVCQEFCSQGGGCLLQISGGGLLQILGGGVCSKFSGGVSAPNFRGGGVCSKLGGVSAPNFRGGVSPIFRIRSTFGLRPVRILLECILVFHSFYWLERQGCKYE